MSAPAPELVARIEGVARDVPGVPMHFLDEKGVSQDVPLAVFLERARTIAAALAAAGVRPRETVVIRAAGGSRAAAEAVLACLVGGFVAVPLVSLLGDGDADTILTAAQARALLAERSIKDRDLTHHLRRVAADQPAMVVGGIGALADDPEFALPAPVPWSAPDWSAVAGADVAVVLFSSGTTGLPKGVMHSYDSLLSEVLDFADQLDLIRDGCILQPFPLGHIGGIAGLLIGAALGRELVMLTSWNARAAFDAIERHSVTGSGSTPYFAQTLFDERDRRGYGLASVRAMESGGGFVGRDLVYRAAAYGIPLSRGYGSTEHPTVTTHHCRDALEVRAGSDGRPTGGSEVRIVDEAGRDCPPETDGEVWVRGPEQFLGYLSGDTSALRDEWFRTGDIGRLSAAGYLSITGRLKDIIIRGGENISVAEVERLLTRHPAVDEAAVVGVPDPRYGERVHAYVVLAEQGDHVDLELVRSHFAELGVARHKTPEFVTVLPRLPRNSLGKVQKHLLREM